MKLSNAATLLTLAAAAEGAVQLPFAKGAHGSVRKRNSRLSKRAFTESLINNLTEGGYYASVSVGTPGQVVSLLLDTGSSDAWVISSSADLCTEKRLQIAYDETCGSTYNSSASSTYDNVDPGAFDIEYVDGSGASGDYVKDAFEIDGKTLQNVQIGVADQTTVDTGILGVGFEANEAATTLYPNVVTELVSQGMISTMAYSLYLNDYFSSTGSILFGGVDTEKFIGDLAIVPILPDAQTKNYSSFTVGLTGLSLVFPNGTSYNQSLASESGSLDSVLDSGTTLSYLPDALATPIFTAVGAYVYTSIGDSAGLALVDCSLSLNLYYTINGTATITVPTRELVLDEVDQTTVPDGVPFDKVCVFGIQSIGDTSDEGPGSAKTADYAILGDTFLRSAYVVYDLSNKEIGLAQSNLNSTSSNVQDLASSASGLPSTFSGVASQTVTTGGSSGSGTGTGTSTATASGSGSASSSSSQNSAAKGRLAPGFEGLFAVVGASVVFAVSGSLLFWM